MKNLLLITTLAITVLAIAFGSESIKQDTSGKIVGTWKSLDNKNGGPLAVVTVKRTENKLSGTVILSGLTQGDKEDVTLELPITDAKFDGAILSFKIKFPEPESIITDWEFKLRNDDEAGFKLVKENDGPVEDAPSYVMKRVTS